MIASANSTSEPGGPEQVNSIVVLGGGTAGMLAALAIKRNLPDVDVQVIRSTRMGVIGVGEGTIPSVVHFLHRFLGLDAFDLYSKVHASPKLGIRYLWGKRPYFNYTFSGQLVSPLPGLDLPRGYYCHDDFSYADMNAALMCHDKVCFRLQNGAPKFNNNVSYHLENKRFVSYLEKLTDEANVLKIDDVVNRVQTSERGIEKLFLEESGREISADLFVDCSGFRAELIGKGGLDVEFVDYRDALFCDRAVVGGWERTDEIYHPFTTAETMQAGWCWRIEHDDLINRGYVFCSQFLSDDEAVEEYQRVNPRANVGKVIQFQSGVRRQTWCKNVVAVGNSAGFVEPLEATAIGMICDGILRMVKALQASGLRNLPIQREIYNRVTGTNWQIIKDFLALHYKFNNRFDSPFWRAAQADVHLGDAQQYVDYYREVGPDFSILNTELKRDFFTAEGYLVMMLGQQVPFKRPTSISTEQRNTWSEFRDKIATVAKAGINVPDFLKMARSPNAREYFRVGNQVRTAAERRPAKVGENVKSGELNWH